MESDGIGCSAAAALPYGTDQWSPINTSGKKMYSKEFLMALKIDPKSNEVPENLPVSIQTSGEKKKKSVKKTPKCKVLPPGLAAEDLQASVVQPKEELDIETNEDINTNDFNFGLAISVIENSLHAAQKPASRIITQSTRAPITLRKLRRTPTLVPVTMGQPILPHQFHTVPLQPSLHYGNTSTPIQYFGNVPGTPIIGYRPPGFPVQHPTPSNVYQYSQQRVLGATSRKVPGTDQSVNILEEYLNNRLNIQEVAQKIKTSILPPARPQMIIDGFLSVLETSKQIRLQTGYLFGKLIKLGCISLEDYYMGSLEVVLKKADELVIDIPRVWDYIAEVVFPVMCEGAVETKNLHKMFNLLITRTHAAKLLTRLFKLMINGNEDTSLSFADYTNVASEEFKIQSPIVSPSAEPMPAHLNKILEEYLNDRCSVQECLQQIKTSISPSEISQLVSFGSMSLLEKSKISRLRTGFLFSQLIKLNILSVPNYCVGLEIIFEKADQLVIDTPKVWTSMAELLSPVISNNAVTLKDLHSSLKLLKGNKNHLPELLNCLLKLIIQDKGITFLQTIWNNSGLTFTDFIEESQVENFVKTNNFDFLLKTSEETSVVSNPNQKEDKKLYEIENTEAPTINDCNLEEIGGTIKSAKVKQLLDSDNIIELPEPIQPILVPKLVGTSEGPVLTATINDSIKEVESNVVPIIEPAKIETESQDKSDSPVLEADVKPSVETKINVPCDKNERKMYDRDFLLNLRKDPKSNEKPDDLPVGILPNKNIEPIIEECVASVQILEDQDHGCDIKTHQSCSPENICTENDEKLALVTHELPCGSQQDSVTLPCQQQQNCSSVEINPSYQELFDKLLEFFKSGASTHEIKVWITLNVGERVKEDQFFRTLATACFEDSVVNLKLQPSVLQKKYSLLSKFVKRQLNYEIQCLYALQDFIDKLQHPPGLLSVICYQLCHEHVFSTESFLAWQTSTDDASESQAKVKAMKQLTSFFDELNDVGYSSSSSED